MQIMINHVFGSAAEAEDVSNKTLVSGGGVGGGQEGVRRGSRARIASAKASASKLR